MSCIHCTHCREEAQRTQDAAMLHPQGTRLIVTTLPHLGVVTYWRGAPDMADTHVVYQEGIKDCPGYNVRAGSLALAPTPKKRGRRKTNA